MNKLFDLISSFISLIITLFVAAIIVVALIYGIDWFISGNNAADAGSTVHSGGTSIVDFATSIFTG